jgi:hypothetical protein
LPCEVAIDNAYPALGLDVRELATQSIPFYGLRTLVQFDEIQQYLPARIVDVSVWDALGEGPDSGIRISLETGIALVVRHIYPPMSLGLEVLENSDCL